jgi:hypothetical protein
MTDGPVWINCSHCRGAGERENLFYVEYPTEFNHGEPLTEIMECPVCHGTGKVDLLLNILNEDPHEA